MATVEYQRHEPLSPRTTVILEVARRNRGLSVRAAAREIGCTPSHLWLVENGRRAPSREMARTIAEVYRVDPGEIPALLAESVLGSGWSKPSRRP